jgi:hypothetical protein
VEIPTQLGRFGPRGGNSSFKIDGVSKLPFFQNDPKQIGLTFYFISSYSPWFVGSKTPHVLKFGPPPQKVKHFLKQFKMPKS